MNPPWTTLIWPQFGASIDMLEGAIRMCPDSLWNDRTKNPEFWYLVYHTLFWLDLYLEGAIEGFIPPHPFTLDELDPAGLLPERPYSKTELLAYLEHCRKKCWRTLEALSDERASRDCTFHWGRTTFAELLLYNMRHVQHHNGQLNLILRHAIDSSPHWVARASAGRAGGQ